MGFFQDLRQDLSQTVTDMNAEETVGDIDLDTDIPTSSEDLFGDAAEGDFADLARLEKEAAALNDELVMPSEENTYEALPDENVSEDLPEESVSDENVFEDLAEESVSDENAFEDLAEENVPEDAAEEIVYEDLPDENDEVGIDAAEEEQETVPETDAAAVEEEIADAGVDMPVNEENNEIREADAEMEELLNEVEQNIEEQTFMDDAPQEVQSEQDAGTAVSTDTAVITAGMKITGDVTSSGNMDLIGDIVGNIDILGKLNVTGGITGNSSAAEIYAESAQINGEIKSKGSVKIGQSSVVIGNIFATSAVIAGAVKGDIDVHGPVILDTSAIVMGNIKSKSVQINNGAVIEGMCSQCYADVSPTSFFNDVKKNRKQQ